MWCFFDESYPDGADVACICACLMRVESLSALNKLMYNSRRKHFGSVRAKDLSVELKGTSLLSNQSFKMLSKGNGYSINQQVADDVLRGCVELPAELTIKIFGAAVYGEKDILKKVQSDRLAFPVVEVLRRVSAAACEMDPNGMVDLVFDQQLAEKSVAISIRKFIAGVQLPNVSQFPLAGVSHVSPGLQLADLGAYILGRRAAGDQRFHKWMMRLRQLEWSGIIGGYNRMGIQRWDSDGSGRVRVRQKW
jgi:hypothetical protein